MDESGRKKFVLDKHVFLVPERYLTKGSIPWLPADQHEGLSFIINPDETLQDQHIVTINEPRLTCGVQGREMSDMLLNACSESKTGNKIAVFEGGKLDKIFPYEGITFQWGYVVKSKSGDHRMVADCASIKNGSDGLCHSLGVYKELVFSVSFRDRQIDSLATIQNKVRKMLMSWEVDSNGKT